jgi:tetratricopeptide (TPR) repeat protein
MSGRPAEGREAIQLATRLDPRGALDIGSRSVIATGYYFDRDYENAVAATRRLLGDRPDHPFAYRWLAAALGQLGQIDEARDSLDQAIAIAPDTIELYVRHRVPWMRQTDYDHMLEGLRKAGWRGDVNMVTQGRKVVPCFARSLARHPGVHDLYPASGKVAAVARCNGQAVGACRCRNHGVRNRNRPSDRFTSRTNSAI